MTIVKPPYLLRPATAQETDYIHACNAASWAGPLTLLQYRERERVLSSVPLTRNGGITCWVLVESSLAPSSAPEPHTQYALEGSEASAEAGAKILSSCETIKKLAYVARPETGKVEEVMSHGVGSVFTPKDKRGNGYAPVMLRLLAETLKREKEDGFSVLFSDIGKEFYARLGWLPHRSTTLEFPVEGAEVAEDKDVRELGASDVPALCVKDVTTLQEELALPHDKTRIAFAPDYAAFEWHWAREEFIASCLHPELPPPSIKGAITADSSRWVIWQRNLGEKLLNVLRIANHSTNSAEAIETEIVAVASLLRKAAAEARKWGLQKVYLWNPDSVTVEAAKRVSAKVTVVEREVDSICSLMMHEGGSSESEVDWVLSEKFSWC